MSHRRSHQTLEELARYYGWDEELTRLLERLPRIVTEQYLEQAWSYDEDGWRHILPTLSASTPVLCLEARFGNTAAAFARTGAPVTVIHPCPITTQIIRRRLAALKLDHVDVIQIDPQAAELPFPNGRYGAFIRHDVAGTLPAGGASNLAAFSPALVSEVFRILKPDGFAYFGAENPFSYTRWRKPVRQSSGAASTETRLMPVGRAKALVRQAGFRNVSLYPYLVEIGRVTEVIAPSGYQSTKNPFTASERFKRIILGRHTARFLTPAHGFVCAKNSTAPSSLDGIIQNLTSQGILSSDSSGFRRYLALPGKTIIALGQTKDDESNLIVVIPKVQRVLEWRRKEIGIVNELRALSPFLASRLPRLYTECSSDGETYFAISEISGMVIDRRVPHLALLTRNAVDFLIRFNQITAREIAIDEGIYRDLFGCLTKQVMATYPDTGELIESIEAHLRRFLLGKRITAVWFHGDYKLENLIFDKKTYDINGIIDWEHSRRNGLPWLDLLYLLTYNRIMTEDRDFFDVYRGTIQAEDFTKQEKSIIDVYANALPVSGDMRQVMTCLFFLHHIGFRYIYIMRRKDDRRNIFTALEEIERRLARLAG